MKENSNGNDINVVTIEEDIEELKRLLYRNELSQYGKRKLIKYYELQEKYYKRVLKENEELLELRVSASAHNRIIELEKENEEWNRKFCNLQNLYFKLQDESESKRKEYQETYKDVREELKELKNDYENLSNSVVVKNHYIKNSIPIQKVKDLIEELKENGYWNYLEERDLETTIEILKKIIRK